MGLGVHHFHSLLHGHAERSDKPWKGEEKTSENSQEMEDRRLAN
jgi:hypothetical protein